MNFQTLLKVEKPDFYIGLAFKKARERIEYLKTKRSNKLYLDKAKYFETQRIHIINDSLNSYLGKILESFPRLEELPTFYLELTKVTIDYGSLKKSLGGVNWVIGRLNEFQRIYESKVVRCGDIKELEKLRSSYLGRVSSLLKQITEELAYIEEGRKIMKNFPVIKTGLSTVAIIGFPNIGKTTLLFKMTGSKPEIKNYAFTTKNINVGNAIINEKKVQFLDTPGTLNRFEKMNYLEKQSYLAIKYLADCLVYIYDLTEPYPLKDQVKLHERMKETGKKVIVYLSKTDILEKEKIEKFKGDFFSDANEIKKEIGKILAEKEENKEEENNIL